MYARVFGNGEGALLLQDLTARFFDVNVYCPGGIEAQRETERRAARREVVRFILSQMAQLNEPPPTDDTASQPAG
jgi:hypothetical protein